MPRKPSKQATSQRRTRQRIRAVFLQRRETYGPREVQRLTGLSSDRVRGAIEQRELDGELTRTGFCIRWPQLAALALDMWSIAEVEEALGEDAPQALPPLVRMTTLTARVPRYQVVMLEALARLHGYSVDAMVEDALLTVAEESAWELDQVIPGFEEAIDFPEAVVEKR